MALATSFLLKWTVRAKENKAPLDIPFILFVLIMMLAMVVSAVAYLLSPSTGLLLDLIVINMFVMTGGVLPIFLFMSLRLPPEEETTKGDETRDRQDIAKSDLVSTKRNLTVPLVVSLVILNEFFMGWALVIASGGLGYSTNPVSLCASVVYSYWFIFSMSAEMILTTYFLRKEIGRTIFYVVAFQSLVMFLSPTAIQNSHWIAVSVIGGSALMIVLFIYVFEYMARHSSLEPIFATYLFRLLALYGLMMAGLFEWELYQEGVVFSISIIIEMIIYFFLILGGDYRQGQFTRNWLLDAKWTLALISFIFVAEYFMGGLLDVEIYGRIVFLQGLHLAPLAGNAFTLAGAAVYDFLAWFGTVTDSVWFLIMMGIEM